jgi:hypothetical protein
MSFIQRIVKDYSPRNWGESIETESREWMISCPADTACLYGRLAAFVGKQRA